MALLLFVFLLAFSPRSSSIAIGSAGLAFSFTRFALLLFLAIFAVKLAIRNTLWRRFKYALFREKAAFVLVILAFLKLIASLHATGGKSLPYLFDDISVSLLCFLLFYTYTKTLADFREILVVISASALLCTILGAIEFPLAMPLVSFIASGAVAGSEDVLAGITRDASYRLQALFDNPLLLAEFTVLATPFLIYIIQTSTGAARLRWGLAAVATAALLVGTGSRAGVMLYAIEIPAIYVASRRGNPGILLKFIAGFVLLVALCVIIYVNFDDFINLAREGKNGSFWLYDDKERSTLERASQYLIVFEQMKTAPLLGFGVRQSLHNELEFLNRLDSYWLRLLLEAGVLAPILFGSFIVAVLIRVSRADLNEIAKPALLRASLLVFVAVFAAFKLFISIPSNNIYFFIIVGAFFGATQKRNKVWLNAHPACP